MVIGIRISVSFLALLQPYDVCAWWSVGECNCTFFTPWFLAVLWISFQFLCHSFPGVLARSNRIFLVAWVGAFSNTLSVTYRRQQGKTGNLPYCHSLSPNVCMQSCFWFYLKNFEMGPEEYSVLILVIPKHLGEILNSLLSMCIFFQSV